MDEFTIDITQIIKNKYLKKRCYYFPSNHDTCPMVDFLKYSFLKSQFGLSRWESQVKFDIVDYDAIALPVQFGLEKYMESFKIALKYFFWK